MILGAIHCTIRVLFQKFVISESLFVCHLMGQGEHHEIFGAGVLGAIVETVGSFMQVTMQAVRSTLCRERNNRGFLLLQQSSSINGEGAFSLESKFLSNLKADDEILLHYRWISLSN